MAIARIKTRFRAASGIKTRFPGVRENASDVNEGLGVVRVFARILGVKHFFE